MCLVLEHPKAEDEEEEEQPAPDSQPHPPKKGGGWAVPNNVIALLWLSLIM